ncbi:jg10396 [Pararge aegeria aegeria]|uniref:Jg10396 protein n=1 Tax=Pararge aegeria aegeria TaxID=348720 RepID=A0A8S4S5W3_9NEOP|nr:jg10396 [Pararge aegeria aegeria]
MLAWYIGARSDVRDVMDVIPSLSLSAFNGNVFRILMEHSWKFKTREIIKVVDILVTENEFRHSLVSGAPRAAVAPPPSAESRPREGFPPQKLRRTPPLRSVPTDRRADFTRAQIYAPMSFPYLLH